MIKTWIQHFVYERSIDVLFNGLYHNLLVPSVDLSPLEGLDHLVQLGHIAGYQTYIDPITGEVKVDIDASNQLVQLAIEHLFDTVIDSYEDD